MTITQICLASASPRRRELLNQLGLAHICLPQDIDESVLPGEAPADYVSRLALAKVRAALADQQLPAAPVVLGADTTVVLEGRILGKPATQEQARDMLELLSGATHSVLTGIAAGSTKRMDQMVVSTSVTFRKISAQEIQAYCACAEPLDKAGAYAIQGKGALFVSRIEGSYSNVVGLPLFETMQLLGRHGINPVSVLSGAMHEC